MTEILLDKIIFKCPVLSKKITTKFKTAGADINGRIWFESEKCICGKDHIIEVFKIDLPVFKNGKFIKKGKKK